MMLAESPWFLPIAGLAAGFAMGFVARRYHFCTLSALERHWYAADSRGLSSWILAAAVALGVTQLMILGGIVDIHSSFYLSPLFGLTGAIIGGIAFGFGMALVGTCGFGAIVRAGGGSLRSIVVLMVLGLSALAAQRGLIAQLRAQTFGSKCVGVIVADEPAVMCLELVVGELLMHRMVHLGHDTA